MIQMKDSTMTEPSRVTYHTTQVDGLKIFYREAGPKDASTVVLLHGFPSSSHMFRELIPRLSDKYHVVAPDYPGYGYSDAPSPEQYVYTFDHLADTVDHFLTQQGITKYSIYIQDYGSPVGFRLATRHPERVQAIITQNGNAYEEGLSDAWDPIRRYWAEPTTKNRETVRDALLTFEGTRWQYTHGVADPEMIAPESYTLDAALLERPGNKDIQLDLFLDYASNLTLYPVFQKYFSDAKPPLLAIWGKHDPFFIPAGAEAYRRDNPNAVVEFLDTGHFALETHFEKIAGEIGRLMDRASNRAQTQRSKQ